MAQKETTLTSVKIFKNLYNDYKYLTVNDSMSFQKLVNRSIYLYLNLSSSGESSSIAT